MTIMPQHDFIEAIVRGDCFDPFSFLGMHEDREGAGIVARAFLPHVHAVSLIRAVSGKPAAEFRRVHEAGLFECRLNQGERPFRYRLRLVMPDGQRDIEDPYCFPPFLGEFDVCLLGEGNHLRLYERLGAHPTTIEEVEGVAFAVWAPGARRVSVVGPFNDWDGRRHPMRCRYECGVWELFLPGLAEGEVYQFEIKSRSGELLPLKSDPCGFSAQRPPAAASVVYDYERGKSQDAGWAAQRSLINGRNAPMAIYEVHLGSWRRKPGRKNGYLTYQELADELVPYAKEMGFSHLELMPVSEYPFDGSWGYQPIGLFAPTSRFGTPRDFRELVERCHQAGLGLILDWVPGHFPADAHGLARFDGTHLYEHADPRRGRHADWDTLIYNYGRREVANFLLANALFWLDAYQVDGLRVDAVASMLYHDYSRATGEWLPNIHGGNENLEAIAFLRRLNQTIGQRHPGVITIAEESTAWPMVSRPVEVGGLGFNYKWNLGWMHDTLLHMSRDPVHRKYHQEELTFGLLYAHHENFILPLSHDEVVHEKRSLLGRMPGDRWRQFANLRAYYAFMYTQPGKKLLFMGAEFAQQDEWSHDRGLDWHLLDDPMHRGVQNLVRDLNRLYRGNPALHELDCEPRGFAWIDCSDHEQSVLSYLRRGHAPGAAVVVVCNFTPVVRHGYRVGVPSPGFYREILNTDARIYGGGDVGNAGGVHAEAVPMHGQVFSLSLTLPPLAAIILQPENG